MSLKNVRNGFVKSRNALVKNTLLNKQMGKHAHPFHKAKDLTTLQTKAGMAQMRLRELKCTKLKILMSQKKKIYNHERPQKKQQHPVLRSLHTGKTMTRLFTHKTRHSICIVRPTNYILPLLWNKCKGFPLVVWQWLLETSDTKWCNKKNSFKSETSENIARQNIPSTFWRLQQIHDQEPQFTDLQYQRHTYWNDALYDQEKLEFKHKCDISAEQSETDGKITDSHVLDRCDKLKYGMVDLLTVNPQLPNILPIPKFKPQTIFSKYQN